ncbi:protein FAM186B [Ctenodactylus gundi]
MEKDNALQLLTPASVKAIISRIETAQLTRAQEDISTQLSDILDNVSGVLKRFQGESEYDLKEMAKPYQMEPKGKKRFILLEKIASFSKDAKMKEKHLCEIFHWLGDWGDSLAHEIRKSEEEEEALDKRIKVMEKELPLSPPTTEGGKSLSSLCSSLIEKQKKKAQSRVPNHTFWQGWQEKSPQKVSPHPQPLSPEEMLKDEQATGMSVAEVKSMLQELRDSTMFNKAEVKAIGYMSTVVENLNMALILQHKENRSLEAKYRHLQTEMAKELRSQRLHFQKSIQDLESKSNVLLKKVEILEGKCQDHRLPKHGLELRPKKAQTVRGPTEDPAGIFMDSPAPSGQETLPKMETALEEARKEPEEEEQLFSSRSPSHTTMAWNSGAAPSESTLSVHSRIAEMFKDTEVLEPVLSPSEDHKFPVECERLVAERPDHKDQERGDHLREEGGGKQIQPQLWKMSPTSSGEVPWESQAEPWPEGLSQVKREQQRQGKWALMEQGHQEKPREVAIQAGTRQEQQEGLAQPEECPRREPWAGTGRSVFTTTSQWRNLERAEPSPMRPPHGAQLACQGSRPHLPKSSHTQNPRSGHQRSVSSAEFIQMPCALNPPTKPKKSATFPVTETPMGRAIQSFLQRSPVTPKEKVHHMGVEAQKKNLQSELGLPLHLRSKALELTTTATELSACRLQCLCQKYILYRRFQSLRQEVISHTQVKREARASYDAQSLYVFLRNINRQQRLRLQAWTNKQKVLEEKRQECLSSMETLFPKFQLKWNIHLNIPVVTSSKPRKCKSPLALTQCVSPSSPTSEQSIQSKNLEGVPLPRWIASISVPSHPSQQRSQTEAIWKTDVASSSHPIEKKIPAGLPRDHLGGYPDIPQLLLPVQHSSQGR